MGEAAARRLRRVRGTIKDRSRIRRCLDESAGVIALRPVLLHFEQRYVQVTLAAPFVFAYVFQPSGYQYQRGFPIGERADDAGSASDSLFSRSMALFVPILARCCMGKSV